MNKFTKFLLTVIVILAALCLLLNGYSNKVNDMELKVGSKIGGGELSTKEYYTLAQCIDYYQSCIVSGDIERSYNMLGTSYRKYMPYDKYVDMIGKIDFSQFAVKKIDTITQSTFEITVDMGGEDKTYLIIIDSNSNKFSIYPDGFIDNIVEDFEFSKNKLKCHITGYTVFNDRCIFTGEIENADKSNDINISSITLCSTDKDFVQYDENINLKPGEKRQINLEFDTSYDFPKEINFIWNIKGKDKEYTLKF